MCSFGLCFSRNPHESHRLSSQPSLLKSDWLNLLISLKISLPPLKNCNLSLWLDDVCHVGSNPLMWSVSQIFPSQSILLFIPVFDFDELLWAAITISCAKLLWMGIKILQSIAHGNEKDSDDYALCIQKGRKPRHCLSGVWWYHPSPSDNGHWRMLVWHINNWTLCLTFQTKHHLIIFNINVGWERKQ